MNVRAFTADESSGLDSHVRGSYLGMMEKVVFAYLQSVNALLPHFFILNCSLLVVEDCRLG